MGVDEMQAGVAARGETPPMSFDAAAELIAARLYFGNPTDWERCVRLVSKALRAMVVGTREEIADDLERRARELGKGRQSWTKAHTLREYAQKLRETQGVETTPAEQSEAQD
jgi:hypothetical protein